MMPNEEELEEKKPTETEEPEDKPELPKEPVDRNEVIEVKVGEPGSRQQKKNSRYQEAIDTSRRASEEAAAARREAQEAREQLTRLQQHPQSFQSQPQQRDPIEQIDEAIDRLHQQYSLVARSPGFDPQGPQQKEFERQSRQLMNLKMEQFAKRSAPQVNTAEIARQVAWQNFTAEHSDVFSNQKAQDWAWGRYMQLVRGEGQADTRELAEQILDEARIKHGMQPRRRQGSRPDQATQRRLSGISAQSGGGEVPLGNVKMGEMERKMARELYDKDPPEVAYQKWANGPGKRAMEKAARK